MTVQNVADWLTIIRAEYCEIPGLVLTRAQVRRLWNLDEPTVDLLLQHLESTNFLRRTRANGYVKAEPVQ